MNTWLSNFSEYKGILNPLCITCICCNDCKELNESLHEHNLQVLYCNGNYYEGKTNETTKGT